MLVWTKSGGGGYNSSYFRAPVMRKASFLHHASTDPVVMRLRFRLKKTRYEKTWELELLQGMSFDGDVVAKGFRTAKDAMLEAQALVAKMGGSDES